MDPQTLLESRQVDQAIQESMAVLKDLRDAIDFDFRSLQQIDQQAQEFLDKTKQALTSSSSSSSYDDDDDVTARRYLSKRQALMDKGTKMNEKIKAAQKQLRILEDNVWSLQTRSMELNARIRGELLFEKKR